MRAGSFWLFGTRMTAQICGAIALLALGNGLI